MNATQLTYLAAQRHPTACDFELHRQRVVAKEAMRKERRLRRATRVPA